MLRENKLLGILYLIRHCFFSSASLYSFVFPCCCCYLVAKSCLTLCNPMNCIAHQAPLSMGFSRQEYWSGLPFPSPGDLLDLGIEPASLKSPALAEGFFTTSATWEALSCALMASKSHLLHCHLHLCCCCSVDKSCPTLPPYKLQRARLLCPSLSLGVCSNSCPLSQ